MDETCGAWESRRQKGQPVRVRLECRCSNHPRIPRRITVGDIVQVAERIIIDITPAITGVPEVIPSINIINKLNSINKTKGKAPA